MKEWLNLPIPSICTQIFFKCYFSITLHIQYFLYQFQVYSMVIRQSCTYRVSPQYSQCPPGTTHSYSNIIDYISHALLYIRLKNLNNYFICLSHTYIHTYTHIIVCVWFSLIYLKVNWRCDTWSLIQHASPKNKNVLLPDTIGVKLKMNNSVI